MKSFLNACGIKDSLRITIEGPGAKGGESRQFPQPFAMIGRDDRADVILEDPRVSRRHVYLQAVEGWLFWVDLESRTGTRAETEARKSGWLEGRSSIGVGPYVIRRPTTASGGDFALGEPPRDTPLAAQMLGREPLPAVALEFLNGPSQSMLWPMRRVMSLIGSAKGCKFRLTDPSVSAFHASLLRTPAGLWVVDLRGNRSITVNAVPVRSSPLADGDMLGIGRYRIRIQCRDRGQRTEGVAADSVRGTAVRAIARRNPVGLPQRSLSGQRNGTIASQPGPGSRLGPAPSCPIPIIAAASSIEVVSSDTALSGRLAQPELHESVLMPLVSQFSLMQQQMFDQFQQAMVMLVQMFGTMHREQMAVIREELDRLHQLSQELQELKDELAKPSRQPALALGERADPGAAAARDRRPAPEPDRRPALEPFTPAAAAWSRSGDGALTPSGLSAVVPPLTPPAAAPECQPPRGDGLPGMPPLSTSPGVPPDPSRPGLITPGSPSGSGPAVPDHDAVAWIHQRIMIIQSERETRWQKILKLLPGIS
jgi:pSer/pThr/pTyr-binding forkhead associated (FHA) protein